MIISSRVGGYSMVKIIKGIVYIYFITFFITVLSADQGPLPLYYWHEKKMKYINFGDYLGLKILERMVNTAVRVYDKDRDKDRKLLGLGSILTYARDNDVVWGTGINGKWLELKNYKFTHLDVRAVRGPLTREFLMNNFGIAVPEVYGDPALLVPYLFPEFKKKKKPSRDYIVIPAYNEVDCFDQDDEHVVSPCESWDMVITKILDSKFVISSSLHGIIIAEAYGIPARLLYPRKEALFKYRDYYFGTGRFDFAVAYSVEEALHMGGEKPLVYDIRPLYNAFPFEFWSCQLFEKGDTK